MSTPIIAFFNNKGGVGKTSLVYHLAWMYSDLGLRVVAADIDPQANLTAAFLEEDRLEQVWEGSERVTTVFGCVEPIRSGTGGIEKPWLEPISDNLSIIIGDLSLSQFEDELSRSWLECAGGNPRAFRIMAAFWRILQDAALDHEADLILMDLGPNLGAINRGALIAADHVVIPLSADLFSLQGLRNLGPTFRTWREEWRDRLEKNPDPNLDLPVGKMAPIGYVVMQHSLRLDRPAVHYGKWIARIPGEYREHVLGIDSEFTYDTDEHQLALVKHYRSLMPIAQDVHKPIFHLRPADGAIGAHATAAREAGKDFERLARNIISKANLNSVLRSSYE